MRRNGLPVVFAHLLGRGTDAATKGAQLQVIPSAWFYAAGHLRWRKFNPSVLRAPQHQRLVCCSHTGIVAVVRIYAAFHIACADHQSCIAAFAQQLNVGFYRVVSPERRSRNQFCAALIGIIPDASTHHAPVTGIRLPLTACSRRKGILIRQASPRTPPIKYRSCCRQHTHSRKKPRPNHGFCPQSRLISRRASGESMFSRVSKLGCSLISCPGRLLERYCASILRARCPIS